METYLEPRGTTEQGGEKLAVQMRCQEEEKMEKVEQEMELNAVEKMGQAL